MLSTDGNVKFGYPHEVFKLFVRKGRHFSEGLNQASSGVCASEIFYGWSQ